MLVFHPPFPFCDFFPVRQGVALHYSLGVPTSASRAIAPLLSMLNPIFRETLTLFLGKHYLSGIECQELIRMDCQAFINENPLSRIA